MIGPANTRAEVAAAFENVADKRERLQPRKHGNEPLGLGRRRRASRRPSRRRHAPAGWRRARGLLRRGGMAARAGVGGASTGNHLAVTVQSDPAEPPARDRTGDPDGAAGGVRLVDTNVVIGDLVALAEVPGRRLARCPLAPRRGRGAS